VGLFAAAALGAWMLNARRERAMARRVGLGAVGLLVLALLGVSWAPLGQVDTARLLIPALLLATVPASYACIESLRWAGEWCGGPLRAAVIVTGLIVAAGVAGREYVVRVADRCAGTVPLAIGLGPEQEEIRAALDAYTTPQARILWEDRPAPSSASRWTPLLPVLTGRAYLGGLDTNPGIEHDYLRFAEQLLAGRHLADWSDSELRDFCQRYNIGWVVCWSAGASGRFRAWKDAVEVASLHDKDPGRLFEIRRPLSFTLKGQARWLHADSRRIALGDATPENGVLVLSLHHQTGLRAAPADVKIEDEENPYGPVKFVRLRMPGPATRVVLTWEDR
jgi:hypothetical protein